MVPHLVRHEFRMFTSFVDHGLLVLTPQQLSRQKFSDLSRLSRLKVSVLYWKSLRLIHTLRFSSDGLK